MCLCTNDLQNVRVSAHTALFLAMLTERLQQPLLFLTVGLVLAAGNVFICSVLPSSWTQAAPSAAPFVATATK